MSVGGPSVTDMEHDSGPPDRPTHPLRSVLAGSARAIDEVVNQPLWSLGDTELLDLVEEAYGLVSKAHALALSMVSEASARELGDRVGAPSMAALLRHRLRLTPASARRDVDLAKAATPHRHPLLAAALRGTPGASDGDGDGESIAPVRPIRVEQAAAIAAVLADPPPAATATVLADAEATLVQCADTYDAVELRRLGTRIWELVDPDDAEATEAALLARQEARAYARRRLSMVRHGDGTTGFTGQLDDLSAAVVHTALDPLAAPLPRTAEGPDPRSHGQRLADALIELARRSLAGGDLPEHGGVPPQLVVTIDQQQLTGASQTAPDGQDTGPTCDLTRRSDTPAPIGTVDDGTRLSPTEVARYACESDPVLALLTHGIPTWISRRDRHARGVLRLALLLRDGGCAFPGCDRPSSWCHARHIIAWQDGGPTVLDNLVLLCGYHHRLVHRGEWAIVMADDGHPDFLAATWIDPDRRPLRNRAPEVVLN